MSGINSKMTEEEADEIVFYCKDCGEIVETSRIGRKYVYKCKKCGTKNVAFGTKRSLYSFFHLKEDKAEEKVEEKKDDKAEEKVEEKKDDKAEEKVEDKKDDKAEE